MNKIFLTCLLIALIIFPAFIGCTESSGNGSGTATATISRDNLRISVSVDGNLVMPQAFDLRFNAPGNVEEVFVEEGDFVTAGKILATLDSTSQQLDIKSANCSLQQTLSNLYETIPSIQTTYNYPMYYPNAAASMAGEWAVESCNEAYEWYLQGNREEAISSLDVAIYDLMFCEAIFQDAVDNSRLGWAGNAAETIDDFHLLTYVHSWGNPLMLQWQDIIKQINVCRETLAELKSSIIHGDYQDNINSFKAAGKKVDRIYLVVADNVNRIEIRNNNIEYPDRELGLYLFNNAIENLDKASKLIEEGKLNSTEYRSCLLIARHSMEICNSLLGSSNMVLSHGLSIKNYQQYNIDLARQLITLDDRRAALLKTIVVAPFDGTVVSVGVKKNDILSAMDYSSKTAVQLVDTTAIKFQGKVDEIDALNITTGQKALIAVDAVPDRKFTGTVTFISPYGSAESSNVVKFDITIELDPGDISLKGGLTATADIEVYMAENVLLVPLTAVDIADGSAYVKLVNDKGVQEKRQVTLGRQNFQYAEVLDGLNEGDTVAIKEMTYAVPVVTAPPMGPPPGR